MKLLDGDALTLDQLAAEVKADRSTLYKSEMKYLMERGLVLNDRRLGGYYRPDAPPRKQAVVN